MYRLPEHCRCRAVYGAPPEIFGRPARRCHLYRRLERRPDSLATRNHQMDMTGEERIAAKRQVVWVALNDVAILKQCIPGCETLEKLSDTEMTAKVKVGIGPVHATFTGKVTLSDLDPPNGYRLSGEGAGGIVGHARGGATE